MLTDRGGTLLRERFLSEAEWSDRLASREVPQTLWTLVTLPAPGLFPKAIWRIATEGAIVGTILLLLGVLLLHRRAEVSRLSIEGAELERRVWSQTQALRNEIGERELAQRALEEANDLLEKRVEERTRDLNLREEALRESEARFRDFAESSADWFWEMDENLRFAYMSPNVARVAGIPPEGYLGRTLQELLGPDYDKETWDPHFQTLEGRRPFRDFEFSRALDNGLVKSLSISGTPVYGTDGRFLGYRGTGSDFTERRAVEEQLRQAQKMEVVGQLTGGIAHDFNNLLGIIVGNLDLLESEFDGDTEKRGYISSALRSALRGGELTSRLLAFSRRQALRPENIDLNSLVPEVMALLERSLGPSIDVEPVLADSLWPTRLDKAQLETALINLGVNAHHAMPEGGTLRIETRNVEFSWEDPQRPRDRKPGRYIMLSVSDTGKGMSPDVREKAFEPFFTTKEIGQGSGLGLSMVHGFVNQSGGHVAIRSAENSGTTVDLYFPVVTMPGRENQAPVAHVVPVGTGQTVLVVEDEANLRNLAVTQLSALGYQVVEAENGAAALAVLDQGVAVDLLFTDIALPGGIDGVKLAEMARARRSGLKVLYTTGFTENFAAEGSTAEMDVLLKPYRRDILANRLAKALGGTG